MRISDWSSDVCSSDLGLDDAPPVDAASRPAETPSTRKPPHEAHGTHEKLRTWRTTAVLLGIAVVVLAIFLARAWSRPEVPPVPIVRVAATKAAILLAPGDTQTPGRAEEHTSELTSIM